MTANVFITDRDAHFLKRQLPLLLFCIILCYAAGCTCNAPPMRPPAIANETAAKIEYSLVTGPTDTLPSMYEVNLQTYKNPLGSDPYISVTFQGGAGHAYTQSMDAEVIRSDKTIEFESIPSPQVGSQIVLNGTTGDDRLIVDIVLSGQRYRVIDKLMPLKSFG